MKTLFYKYLIVLLLIYNPSIKAQENSNNKPLSYINTIGRYTKEKTVQIIYFPDKKNTLKSGIKNGFLVERAALNDSIFSEKDIPYKPLKKIFPYDAARWKKELENSKGELLKGLTLAKDFLDNIDKESSGSFSLDKGIKELKEQKSKEDFQYLFFVMNAVKNNKIAKALGLSFTDNTTEEGKRYAYRIQLIKPSKLYKTISRACLIETKNVEISAERKIYIKTGDQKLTFIWEENDDISAVFIEKKNNDTGVFNVLNKAPLLRTSTASTRNSYTDKNLTNYTNYEYRFYGFNAFGEKVYFGKAKGMPRDLTPPKKPSLQSVKHIKPEEVHLTWKIPTPLEGDLKGFVVARGQNNRGNFQLLHSKLLPKNTTRYIDKTFSRENKNYYVVQAIDTSGNISSSNSFFVTLIDSIPPKKPVFITGKIDSVGIVTLDIALNKEKDLMGYRLFRANSDKHEFSVIQEGFQEKDTLFQKAQTIFKDTVTINSLTPYIYYKIKALDYNFNQSEYSEVLKVKRPDIIPPTTPIFKNIKTGTDAIELYFVLSKSEDVVAHYLYRKLALEEPWILLSELALGKTSYTDTGLKQGIKYYYSLRAKDDSELYSNYAIPIYGKPYDDGVRPPVKNLRISKEKEIITLKWEYEHLTKNTYFVIYKKNKKGNLVQYKNTLNLFFDENSSIKESSYAIKAFTKDGGQSKISDIVRN